MSKTLHFVAFASSVNQNANNAGQPARSLTLQGVLGDPRAKPPVPGPNDALFDGSGRAQVSITGMTHDAITGFKAGARYKVTIHEIHEAPSTPASP